MLPLIDGSLVLLTLIFVLSITLILSVRQLAASRRPHHRQKSSSSGKDDDHVACDLCFFHPHTIDGGGGERVLWCIISAIESAIDTLLPGRSSPGTENADAHLRLHIYTGDDASPSSLAARPASIFGLDPPSRSISFHRVHLRSLSEPRMYPIATLLCQLLLSAPLAIEALLRAYVPGVVVDTSGSTPLIHVVANVFGIDSIAYVHYPLVSSQMLGRVRDGLEMYNNRASFTSGLAKKAKTIYYMMIRKMYGIAMRNARLVMANSSWTANEVRGAMKMKEDGEEGEEGARERCQGGVHVVYPPCDTARLNALPLKRDRRAGETIFVSVAQFRPEKDHAMQLRAFARALRDYPRAMRNASLEVVGSCRNAADEKRLDALRVLAKDLDIADVVHFHVALPFPDLVALLGRAHAGLHTMEDEHFGIVVVEYMAAGAVPIAHNSAGPRMDIVGPANDASAPMRAGFLARSEHEYATAIGDLASMREKDRLACASAARDFVIDRFSIAAFHSRVAQLIASDLLR